MIASLELFVKNLELLTHFYQETIGLELISQTATHSVLGYQKIPLLTLEKATELAPAGVGEAGLYHFALLFASREGLAATLKRVFENTPDLYSGSGDHLVSEAFYLTDPEGNGIELYYDRDPQTWQWQNGQIKMAARYIDVREYMELHLVTDDADLDKKIGHVHLKVGNIETARKFYVDVIGLNVTAELPSALFVSFNKYHHHLGLNTWESQDADAREASLGLKKFELILPAADYQDLAARLDQAGIPYQRLDNGLEFADPWQNVLIARSDT